MHYADNFFHQIIYTMQGNNCFILDCRHATNYQNKLKIIKIFKFERAKKRIVVKCSQCQNP